MMRALLPTTPTPSRIIEPVEFLRLNDQPRLMLTAFEVLQFREIELAIDTFGQAINHLQIVV